MRECPITHEYLTRAWMLLATSNEHSSTIRAAWSRNRTHRERNTEETKVKYETEIFSHWLARVVDNEDWAVALQKIDVLNNASLESLERTTICDTVRVTMVLLLRLDLTCFPKMHLRGRAKLLSY